MTIKIDVPRNEQDGGGAPWVQVKDVLFEDNVLQHIESFAFNILGTDDIHPSATTERIAIRNNLILDAGSGALVQAPMTGLEFVHNTFVRLSWKFLAMDSAVTAACARAWVDAWDGVATQ